MSVLAEPVLPPTRMFVEAGSAGSAVAAQFAADRSVIDALAARLRADRPRLVVTCARGSSDHAATFAKYLIEQELGIPVVSFTPSLSSLHGKGFGGKDVLFLAISQSGGSPDILAAAQLARSQGALVAALVNVVDSPLARAAECVIPLHAGPELSVAATKSFITTLAALLQLVAAWSDSQTARAALDDLPRALEASWAQDWAGAAPLLAEARSLFVIGRGLGLGTAQELALKFKETCRIHAEAFSGAEVRHGPMALVDAGFPVIVLAQNDESLAGLEALAAEFAARGARVLTAGLSVPGGHALPLPAAPAVLGPLLAIQGCYQLVNALALARGLDPDHPPHLAKVTRTL